MDKSTYHHETLSHSITQRTWTTTLFSSFFGWIFQVNNKINHWIIRFIASTTSVAPANVPEGVMELYSYPLVMADIAIENGDL